MFMLCEAMKWSHLPVAGGIYDQDPDLLDGFLIIFQKRSEHEAREAEKDRPKGRGVRGASRHR